MRFLIVLPILMILSACGPQSVQVISDTPKYSRGDYYQYRNPSRAKSLERGRPVTAERQFNNNQSPQSQQSPEREWEIHEDRFLSTHSVESSVEAFKDTRTPDEIKERMRFLETQ